MARDIRDTDACKHCTGGEEFYESRSSSPNVFIVHTQRRFFCGQTHKEKQELKTEKKKTLQDIDKRAAALRNTNGGVVLVHLDGQKSSDRCLEYFHEAVGKRLQTLIEGGEIYTDVFTCKWLSDIFDIDQHHDIVYIGVGKTTGISTVDFNTRVRSDFEIEHPSPLNIVTLLSKRQYGETTKPRLRGLKDASYMHECRNTELKAFRPNQKILSEINRDTDKFVNYIWSDLKLKENIASISKYPDGGSYYLGIDEQRVDHDGYVTKVLKISGFHLPEGDVRKSIYSKLKSEISILHLNGKFDHAPSDLIEIEFHHVEHSSPAKYVLEVAIRYFSGLVFFDKQGPRTYKIKDGKICRMEREEWFERMCHRLPPMKIMY